MMLALIVFQASISACGVLLLRWGLSSLTRPVVLGGTLLVTAIGAFLYLASFLLWLYILSKNPASEAFPVSVAATLVFVTLGASVFLREQISTLQILGIVFVFVGIVLISWRSQFT
jgi:drug/metabolite transporter (DMT)-like permease